MASVPGIQTGSDRELLHRFARDNDQAAFEALVERHGAMVLNTCQRVLHCRSDAEDAFQATFMALARQAGRRGWQESAAGWLCRVAHRLALNLRLSELRRQRRQARLRPRPAADPLVEISAREFVAALDQELAALPDRYRSPLVLCCLEGASGDEAARQLGCSLRTIKRRLERGRKLLRSRLARRGLVVSAPAISAALLTQAAPAAVPFRLTAAVCQRAAVFAGTGLSGPLGLVSQAAILAEQMLESMTMTRLKLTPLVVFTLGAGLVLPGLLIWQKVLAGAAAGVPAASRTDLQPMHPVIDDPDKPLAGKPTPKTEMPRLDPAAVACRAWAIMDLIEQHHVKPCSRQEMLQGGVMAFIAQRKLTAPKDLERQLAGITTAEELAGLLERLFKQATQKRPAGDGQGRSEQWESILLEGMLAKVPGHPNLIPADFLKIAEQVSGNRYVGTGIQIRMNPKAKVPEILNPFRGGPARRAGVRPGDLLVEVDGKNTKDVNLQTVVRWLRGEQGAPITIVVRQPGASETRTLTMTRGVVPFDNVLGYRRMSEEKWEYRIDPGVPIAYARIASINASTLHELRALEKRLEAEDDRALILDLRFANSEAGLQYAALVADGLLDGGVMWRWHDRQGQTREFRADRDCLFRNWPLAVLVNGETRDRTAGAVAAALQDHGRAVLVGEQTNVDGLVGTLFALPDQSGGIALATGQLERASGRGWPVKPDYHVPTTPAEREAIVAWSRLQELPEPPAGASTKPPRDQQLARAVELLQAASRKPVQ
jgi:C-terminal peptidase prc